MTKTDLENYVKYLTKVNSQLQEKLSKYTFRGSVSMQCGTVIHTTGSLLKALESLVQENLDLKNQIALEESNSLSDETTNYVKTLLKSAGIKIEEIV
jgi:hypothetical protein